MPETTGEHIKSKRQIIIEKAAILIQDKGYPSTTMRDLAAEVGMEAASLYNHIKSKRDILHEICFSLAMLYTEKMEKVHSCPDSSPTEKLKNLIKVHIQINTNSPALASVMNEEWRHLIPADQNRFVKMRHEYEDKFTEILEAGIQSGEFKKLNARIALFTIISSMRWVLHWYYTNWEFDKTELQETITQMIYDSILVRNQN